MQASYFQKLLLLPCVSAQFFSFNTYESSHSIEISQVKTSKQVRFWRVVDQDTKKKNNSDNLLSAAAAIVLLCSCRFSFFLVYLEVQFVVNELEWLYHVYTFKNLELVVIWNQTSLESDNMTYYCSVLLYYTHGSFLLFRSSAELLLKYDASTNIPDNNGMCYTWSVLL